MIWFKKNKEEPTEVCGFLDLNGQFFKNKEDRDKSNKEIEYNSQIRELCNKFDNIIRAYNLRYWDSIKNLDRLVANDKLAIIELGSKYLKIQEERFEKK